jgi:hypothetical protein
MPGTALGIAVQGNAFVLVVVASALTPAPVRSAERAVATAARAGWRATRTPRSGPTRAARPLGYAVQRLRTRVLTAHRLMYAVRPLTFAQ